MSAAVEAAWRSWNGMHVGTAKDRLRDAVEAAAPHLENDLRRGLEELIQRRVEASNGVDTEWATVTVRELRELLNRNKP
jgi:hypothetical protein